MWFTQEVWDEAIHGEIQEIVNALNSTKDDLHCLCELSTFIGGGGVVGNRNNNNGSMSRCSVDIGDGKKRWK